MNSEGPRPDVGELETVLIGCGYSTRYSRERCGMRGVSAIESDVGGGW